MTKPLDPVRDGFEVLWPWLAALVAGCLMYRHDTSKAVFDSVMRDVVPTAVSVAAIFAGLQGATLAILLTLKGGEVAAYVHRRGYWQRLVRFITSGIVSLAAFIAVAMTCLVLTTLGVFPAHYTAADAVLAALFTGSISASVRIVLIEIKMLGKSGGK